VHRTTRQLHLTTPARVCGAGARTFARLETPKQSLRVGPSLEDDHRHGTQRVGDVPALFVRTSYQRDIRAFESIPSRTVP